MGRDMDVDAQIELVSQRGEFLEVLIDDQLRKRDLVDELDTSRATVNRAISDLEAAGLVERGSEGHTATLAGRLALERYRAYVRESTAVLTASDVLAPLSPDCALDVDAIAGGDAHVAAEPVPYRPRELVHDSIARADAYRAVLPALAAPRHLRLCYEHVITEENPAALVVSPDLFETLRAEFPRQLPAMAATDRSARRYPRATGRPRSGQGVVRNRGRPRWRRGPRPEAGRFPRPPRPAHGGVKYLAFFPESDGRRRRRVRVQHGGRATARRGRPA